MRNSGLPDTYFEYPFRGKRLDHPWFKPRFLSDIPKVTLPDGCNLAIWIVMSVEHFPIDMSGLPFMPLGGMKRPSPSYWDYTQRDYGNRIGVYRLMEIFDRHGIKPDIVANIAALERYPELVHEFSGRGLEIIGGGNDMAHLHHSGLSFEEELAMVSNCVDRFIKLTGQRPGGWMCPDSSISMNTFDVLKRCGFNYTLDMNNDELPFIINTNNGDLIALPLDRELSDKRVMFEFSQQSEEFAKQVEDACDFLLQEAQEKGGRILTLNLTPWISGQPFRVEVISNLLAFLKSRDKTVFMNAQRILEFFN